MFVKLFIRPYLYFLLSSLPLALLFSLKRVARSIRLLAPFVQAQPGWSDSDFCWPELNLSSSNRMHHRYRYQAAVSAASLEAFHLDHNPLAWYYKFLPQSALSIGQPTSIDQWAQIHFLLLCRCNHSHQGHLDHAFSDHASFPIVFGKLLMPSYVLQHACLLSRMRLESIELLSWAKEEQTSSQQQFRAVSGLLRDRGRNLPSILDCVENRLRWKIWSNLKGTRSSSRRLVEWTRDGAQPNHLGRHHHRSVKRFYLCKLLISVPSAGFRLNLCTYFNSKFDCNIVNNFEKSIRSWYTHCKIHANIDQVPTATISNMRQISYILWQEYIEHVSKPCCYKLLPYVHAKDFPRSSLIREEFLC